MLVKKLLIEDFSSEVYSKNFHEALKCDWNVVGVLTRALRHKPFSITAVRSTFVFQILVSLLGFHVLIRLILNLSLDPVKVWLERILEPL